MNTTLIVLGVIVVIIIIALMVPVFTKSRKVNLTGKSDTKPEWMRETPPAATQEATLAEGEGVTVFNEDPEEELAAPFAEQIEDVLRARLASDDHLKQFKVDFGTSDNGELVIWVNGEKYNSIASLPDEKLKKAFKDSVKEWNK